MSEDPEDLFSIDLCLGEGTYGSVWKGKDKRTNTNVAVKIIPIIDDDQYYTHLIAKIRSDDSNKIINIFY